MKEKEKAVIVTAKMKKDGIFEERMAKLPLCKDISKVCAFFRYTTGTTLDAAIATGILRNSITWYVAQLEDMGLIQAVRRLPDKHTGRMAKHYSAQPSLWHQAVVKRQQPIQLELFDK